MQGVPALIDALKKNICGPVKRSLVPGAMKVYPMDGIGFLQIGVHRFCEIRKDGSCPEGGEAQFAHLWKKTGETWKVIRIISFDHQPLN